MKNIFLTFLLVLFSVPFFAQVENGGLKDVNGVDDRTGDSIQLTKQTTSAGYDGFMRPVPGITRKGNNPVLFLVGNSTMRTGTKGNGNNGQWGWGYFAHEYFDESRITVENHALGGMSSRTFYKKLWPDVLKGVQKGDWVIIELGHNDNGPYDSGRARASIPGISADTVLYVTIKETGERDTVYSYGEYMRKFIREVRAKGANPVLCSLTPRNSWDDETTITRKWNTFTPWGKAVAAEMGCPWIDLEGESAQRLEKFGHWKTEYMFYYVDKIHTSAFGARNNAYSAALAIQHCDGLELKKYLLPLDLPTVEVPRAQGKKVVLLTGDSTVNIDGFGENTKWGWGNVAQQIFGSDYTVVNCAKAGRSTRTFLNEGRWDKVYNTIQPGDYVLIQFGHNDIGAIDKEKERGVIPCGQDSTKVFCLASNGRYEAVYSFGWYLKKFIMDAREKGGIPVLCSLTPRNIWGGTAEHNWPKGKIERRNDTYGKWYREVCDWYQQEVDSNGLIFIDVHNLAADYFDKKGQKKTAQYYKDDHTHLSKKGAEVIANIIKKELEKR